MAKIKSYENLLSAKRERSTATPGRELLQESESDRARFVFSSPFRRLQQKAQVYSLEDNAAVRSRLTHSLEVAHVGRFIVQLVVSKLKPKALELKINGKELFIQNLVETACLMHDVGNPPFGHFGEAAISDWFGKNARRVFEESVINRDEATTKVFDTYLGDFIRFDGNCQGLRVLARLQWNRDEFGLNLMLSQLATYLKYVVSPSMVDSTSSSKLKKKPGFFEVEKSLVNQIWGELGMVSQTRFPLNYLMEAADDIAYCISDIEDGIEKELIKEKDFFEWISNEWDKNYPTGKNSDADAIAEIFHKSVKEIDDNIPIKAFTNFRTNLTTALAKFAADSYVDRHDDFLNGIAEPIFEGAGPHQHVLEILKGFAFKNLYSSSAATNNEMAGFSVISGILEHYSRLLSCDRETFFEICHGTKNRDRFGNLIVLQRRLFRILPQKYVRAYEHVVNDLKDQPGDSAKEWMHRAHLITDYISGMTDDFSLEIFQLLSGIKVGKPI